jgi:hypothetical protein
MSGSENGLGLVVLDASALFEKQIREMTTKPPAVYCAAPWNHLHVHSDGFLGACCISPLKVATNDVEEGYNSEPMKELRRFFMRGEPHPKYCQKCITPNSPYRAAQGHNTRAAPHRKKLLDATLPDGTTTFQPRTIDVRGNTCNLACRMCSSQRLFMIF